MVQELAAASPVDAAIAVSILTGRKKIFDADITPAARAIVRSKPVPNNGGLLASKLDVIRVQRLSGAAARAGGGLGHRGEGAC